LIPTPGRAGITGWPPRASLSVKLVCVDKGRFACDTLPHMFHRQFLKRSLVVSAFLAFLAFLFPLQAQLTINGVVDKTSYNNAVSFTVVTEPGYTYAVFLNSDSVPAGMPVTVDQPDFYQLSVQRIDDSTSAVTNRLIRFIVAASDRLGTELGLPRQVPWPLIQSSTNEAVGASLHLMMPADFPVGYEIPFVAWLSSSDLSQQPVRANGLLAAPGHPAIQVRRGIGSGFLGSTNAPGELRYSPVLLGHSELKVVNLEPAPAWTTLSGVLPDTTWPEGARIQVTGHLTIPAGTTLTIGPGAIIRLNGGVNLTNNGNVVINGTVLRPVVFMPTVRAQPWGGFVSKTLNAGTLTGTGVIFTGSGAVANWFPTANPQGGTIDSHRKEQALFFCLGGQQITLTDAAAFQLAGQLGHSYSSANPTAITLTRFLMQRTTTGGEFTGARFRVNDSAFIECPDDSANFVDGDNDALYLVDGSHNFTNTLFGWTKDDGVDSGGDGVGRLHYEGCWFEAMFHEGNSLSGLKNTTAHGTVYMDCGQGLEAGYGAGSGGPTGRVDACLFTVCQTGLRHGDNYPSIGNGYPGFLGASNSLLLHNHRDILGYNWRSTGWTNAGGQMSIHNNLLTVPDPNFPDNEVWNPAVDAGKLIPFGARDRAGAAFAVRGNPSTLAPFPDGIPVALSMLCTNEVRLNYSVTATDGFSSAGQLVFLPGKLRGTIPVPATIDGVIRVLLFDPVNADLTGVSELFLQNVIATGSTVLSPLGAPWRYLDDGTDQGTAWRAPGFVDGSWSTGIGRLGFGSDASPATTIRRYLNGSSGAQFTNYYFRRTITVPNPAEFATIQFRFQRDDGCVVYLNGAGIITNNMKAGPINSVTLSDTTISGAAETQRFWTNTFPATLLQPGANVIAAEVHQASSTSSDVAWELELQGLPTPPPVLVKVSGLGGRMVIFWNDGTYRLEQSADLLGPWSPAGTTSPIFVNPSESQRFFRLRKP